MVVLDFPMTRGRGGNGAREECAKEPGVAALGPFVAFATAGEVTKMTRPGFDAVRASP